MSEEKKHTVERKTTLDRNIQDYEKLIVFPFCIEAEKDTCWVRYDEDGKYYQVTKRLEYIDGETLIKQSTFQGRKTPYEVREQYSLMWGNIHRNETLSSYEFYLNQMRFNCVRAISIEEFNEKLAEVSQSFESFNLREFTRLPKDRTEKIIVEKIRKEKIKDYENSRQQDNSSEEDRRSDEVPF